MKTLIYFFVLFFGMYSVLPAQVPGSLDTTFQVGEGSNASILNITLQPDNKILLGGYFTTFDNQHQGRVARVHENGSLDTSFNRLGEGANDYVRGILLHKENNILIGGGFTTYNGESHYRAAALDQNGNVDTSCVLPVIDLIGVNFIGKQPDGNILVGGAYRKVLVRIREDGTLDPNFQLGKGFHFRPTGGNTIFIGLEVNSVAVQPDGKIVAAGYFHKFNDVGRNAIARLNPDGTLDTTFQVGTGFNGRVYSLALLPDGKIVASGTFTRYNGNVCHRIARLNPDGSLDTSFRVGTGFDNQVRDMILQPDGKIILGGFFTSFNGITSNSIIRLNADGSFDESFDTGLGFNAEVYSLALQNNGDVIVGGNFTSFNNRVSNRLARLYGGDIDSSRVNIVQGQVYFDGNFNCLQEEHELGLRNWIVQAQSDNNVIYTLTDTTGKYTLYLDDAEYALKQIPRFNGTSTLFTTQICPDDAYLLDLEGLGSDTTGFDFAIERTECAVLKVDVSSNRRLRCFQGQTYISYRNEGFTSAENARIEVHIPQFTIPISSTIPWTSYDENTRIMTFELGTLAAQAHGQIILTDYIACVNAAFDQTQCTEARIYPQNTCFPPSPNWNQADLQVEGRCVVLFDPISIFTVYNRGEGDMDVAQAFRIFSDDILLYEGTVLLAAGDSLSLQVPTQGNSMRIEVDQVAFHPENRQISASVEGCGSGNTQISTGFVNQFPQNDDNFGFEISCMPIVGSYDPNDKLVSPEGFTENHYVKPGTRMEYTIRFQNTGTFTAFTVRVVDTLSADLDLTTFEMLSASHGYSLDLQTAEDGRNVITWLFSDINLPDSTSNEPESHGYIKFKISPQATMVEGTQVENFSDIFFDFNDPIRTNTTLTTFKNYIFPAPDTPVDPCTFISVAKVGDALNTCADSALLSAGAFSAGQGYWTIIQGSGDIQNPGDTTSLVTALGIGENIFRWQISTDICVDNYQDLKITVLETPDKATVENPEANILQSSIEGERYQWYLDGGLMVGQTTRSFEATVSGEYQVEVVQNTCVSTISDVFSLEVTSLESALEKAYGINVRPNPTDGALHISMTRMPTVAIDFRLHTLQGELVENYQIKARPDQKMTQLFDLEQVPAGVYVLEIILPEGAIYKKIIRK